MTAPAPEVVQTDPELTPAEQAMATALAFAVAAEQAVSRAVDAYRAGRLSRVDFAYLAGQQTLQAISKALLAGEHFAELVWQLRVSPKIITSAEHERLVRAFDVVSKDAQKAQADDLAAAISGKVSETLETFDMRATRVARSEVIRAGRTGYAEAVAQAVGDDPDYVWRFNTDADPCGRCVALAGQTFKRLEDAPKGGSHPSCACVLSAELTEDQE